MLKEHPLAVGLVTTVIIITLLYPLFSFYSPFRIVPDFITPYTTFLLFFVSIISGLIVFFKLKAVKGRQL